MSHRKLTYRFHDPNPTGVAADYILQLLIEVNAGKAEAAIRSAAGHPPQLEEPPSPHERPA